MIRAGCVSILAMAMLLSSCTSRQRGKEAECEKLFTMKYGAFDDELDLLDLPCSVGAVGTLHTMKDGFFYVASENKLLEMNSYGAVMYACVSSAAQYNSRTQTDGRRTLAYPLIDVSAITVDAKRRVYIACAMPDEERETSDSGQVLQSIVLRVSRDASGDDYIGRQGVGGSPFPYIKGVSVTNANELSVVCESMSGVEAWYYSDEGRPISHIVVPLTIAVHAAGTSDEEIAARVRDVISDRQTRTLLVCADSYEGQEYAHTYITNLDATSGKSGKSIEIPPYIRVVAEDFGKVSYKMPYDFIGVASNGNMFFVVAVDDGFAMQIVSQDGKHITRRLLKAPRKDCLYHCLSVSDTGIISAMMAEKDAASFMWWRTDLTGE